jgi:hypothetical protein
MSSPTGTLLLMTLALGACGSGVDCTLDDPAAIRLVVSDRVSGALLVGISGTVTSASSSRPILCYTSSDREECFGWAASGRVAVQVTREGFVPWDTAGVQVAFTGGACSRPIMRDLVVRLQPTP